MVPALKSGPRTTPNAATARLAHISIRRRPVSASTAEIGIVSAKNRIAKSCMTRNFSRLNPSALVPHDSANTVIR